MHNADCIWKTNLLVFIGSLNLNLSYHCQECADTLFYVHYYSWPFILIFLVPIILIDRGMVHVHAIKLSIHFVIGTPPSVCSIFSGIILGLLDNPRLKVFHAVKKSRLVPFLYHWKSVAYWLVAGHDWLWVIIYCIQLLYTCS